jgi:hypothetical protein
VIWRDSISASMWNSYSKSNCGLCICNQQLEWTSHS